MAIGEGLGSFTIELDRPGGRYRAGEIVSGAVLFTNIGESVRGVDLKLRWFTSGKGNTDHDDVRTERLPIVALGGRARARFALSLPPGPVSYAGPIITVAWELVVSVDVAWARDPVERVPIEVVAGEAQADAGVYRAAPAPPVRHALGPDAEQAGSIKPRKTGVVFFSALTFGAVATQFGQFGAYILAPAAFLLAGTALWQAWRRSGARHALGQPRFELLPPEVRGGESVQARITLQPHRDLDYLDGWAELHGREIAVRGSGSSSTTHNHTLQREQIALEGPETPRAGQAVTLAATVPIARGAAPSFGAPSNHVSWTITLKLAARQRPGQITHELEEELVLHVQPS
jgi:hypothetical protein